ncbi:unnamed protein product [Knipowitschia caucasica]|uniref:Uncharacterized protein n=1 Tax=Knipowitschia caucasica TaxID=637954 RepID=A0AAV2M0I3_KNICA
MGSKSLLMSSSILNLSSCFDQWQWVKSELLIYNRTTISRYESPEYRCGSYVHEAPGSVRHQKRTSSS